MMLEDLIVSIKINPRNRKKYSEILSNNFENGDVVDIKQKDILSTSRILVSCICDQCGATMKKERVSIKGEKTYCDKNCRNKSIINPNPQKDKIKVYCNICNVEIEVPESKYKSQNHFFCSKSCYWEFRKKKYNKKEIYNYQDMFVKCSAIGCNEDVKTSKWYLKNKKNLFCSQECYWQHRRDFYKELYYKRDLNDSRKETNIERMIREYLTSKNIEYIQEAGFLRKYYVDFYLPNHNIIIEAFGDYWHVNPKIYDVYNNDKNKRKMNKSQQKFLDSNHDEIKIKELESIGYKVYVIWESDIYSDLESEMDKIFKYQQ